ncbi:MAG TPA: PsiF family protein [Gallionellaceae bacterium]
MKKLIALATLGFMFAVSAPAFATPQQDKMKACNKEATGKKGDERKAFMKSCLSKDGAAAPAATAASSCEATAAGKKLAGAAKASFIKKCEKDAAAK